MKRVITVQEPWYSKLVSGAKKVEGRKATEKWLAISAGDIVTLDDHNGNQRDMLVTAVRRYKSVEDYLLQEGLQNALPGVTTIEEGVKVYSQWSTAEELEQYDFLAIELSVYKNTIDVIISKLLETNAQLKLQLLEQVKVTSQAIAVNGQEIAAGLNKEWAQKAHLAQHQLSKAQQRLDFVSRIVTELQQELDTPIQVYSEQELTLQQIEYFVKRLAAHGKTLSTIQAELKKHLY